jgi:hypothetical protein
MGIFEIRGRFGCKVQYHHPKSEASGTRDFCSSSPPLLQPFTPPITPKLQYSNTPCFYPFTTPMGRSRATFLEMPAPCTTSTTSEISL